MTKPPDKINILITTTAEEKQVQLHNSNGDSIIVNELNHWYEIDQLTTYYYITNQETYDLLIKYILDYNSILTELNYHQEKLNNQFPNNHYSNKLENITNETLPLADPLNLYIEVIEIMNNYLCTIEGYKS